MHKGIETSILYQSRLAFFYDPTAYMHKGIETALSPRLFANWNYFLYDPTAYMHKGIETIFCFDLRNQSF